jgi:hypothetical protein
MSKNIPSTPVCLYDRMAISAAVDAGYPTPDSSTQTLSTSTIVAVSVGTTLGVVVLVGIITVFIIKRRQLSQRRQSVQLIELLQFTGGANL